MLRCPCQICIEHLPNFLSASFHGNLVKNLKIDFRYKILKYQCKARTQDLSIDWRGNFQLNLT